MYLGINEYKMKNYDEDFFAEIDSEEKAYWLGFICADGYLNSRHNTVGICLDIKDIEHLNKFKKVLSLNKELKVRKSRYSHNHKETTKVTIEVYSTKMDSDLRKLGLTETKSNTLGLVQVPDYLMNHFIRGYFDGDGCVFSSFSKKGTKKYFTVGFTFVGTETFLNFVNSVLPFKVKSLQKDKRANGSYTLYICSRTRFLIMYEYLYKNATIYLDRKFEKASIILKGIKEASETKEATTKKKG